jgi:hypothetical protein
MPFIFVSAAVSFEAIILVDPSERAFSVRNAVTLPDGLPRTTAAHGWHDIPAKIAEIEDCIMVMGL